MDLRKFIAVFALYGTLFAADLSAQEHPFITHYSLTEISGGINIEWTLQGGSTCNGQDIERSVDGLRFEAVHRILGICGDPEVAVSFNWLDIAPPEFSTVHYRIKLGSEGYTSIKTVVYEQLVNSDQRFFPSPMRDEATLLLNVPIGAMVDLQIWDAGGKLVLDRRSVAGPKLDLFLPNLRGGVYSYNATSQGKRFKGRFVKE